MRGYQDPMTSAFKPENLLPGRSCEGHKGTFGRVLIIAGSPGMAGAAYLSGMSAYRSGCGLVEIFTHEENRIILQQLLPEAVMTTYSGADDGELRGKLIRSLDKADAAAVGCGLGLDRCAALILGMFCRYERVIPTVADADALTLLAEDPDRLKRLEGRPVVITPHPREMSRLNGMTVKEIVSDRTGCAREYASLHSITCLLKGHRTVVATPGEQIYVNQTGNDGMAAGGSGDVLTGLIAGLLAQGMSVHEAACLGAWIHGAGGDRAAETHGRHSMMARDLIQGICNVIREIEN